MANRRMFSKKITNSSEFLMMSQSAQALYLHIGMNADDDGICELFPIMRMTDAKPDDISLLHAKGFVFVVDTRVVFVKDWHENNFIRSDRYEQSRHMKDPRIKQLYEEIMPKKLGIPVVDQRSTEVRLGKVNNELSKNESSLLREVHEREDGSERPPRVIRAPKDRTAWKLMHVFGDKCHKTLGTRPVLGVKECAIVSRALKHITESQMLDLFDEWFEFGHSDDETISIGKSLSNRQIEQYKLRNEIV